MRYATIYQIKDKLIFCSNAQTVDHLSLVVAPYIHLSREADADVIAATLKKVIEANQTDLPHPKQNEWADRAQKHLENTGIKSMSVMRKKVIVCHVTEKGDEFVFTPTTKEGTKGAFLHVIEENIIIDNKSSPDHIAKAIKEALRLSER